MEGDSDKGDATRVVQRVRMSSFVTGDYVLELGCKISSASSSAPWSIPASILSSSPASRTLPLSFISPFRLFSPALETQRRGHRIDLALRAVARRACVQTCSAVATADLTAPFRPAVSHLLMDRMVRVVPGASQVGSLHSEPRRTAAKARGIRDAERHGVARATSEKNAEKVELLSNDCSAELLLNAAPHESISLSPSSQPARRTWIPNLSTAALAALSAPSASAPQSPQNAPLFRRLGIHPRSSDLPFLTPLSKMQHALKRR